MPYRGENELEENHVEFHVLKPFNESKNRTYIYIT